MDGYVRQVDVVAFMLGPPIGDRPERPVIGTNLIASLSEPPYECVWTPPTAATYTLKISAVDNRGATAWSDPVTVRVLSSNQSPSLVWLTPEDHVKRVVVGDTVDFQLLGYDTDGRIERITLELDGSLLSESSGSEFHFSWSPTVPTSVTLTATAVDDRGGVVTLPARILDIVEPLTIPVRILGVEIHPLNGTTLRVAGPSGWTLVLESSPDLLHWDPVGTNTLSSGSSRIVDPALPTAPARFYRARIE
jgi:hypothetical protein